MSDQAVLLPKYQHVHSYPFWTMPILIFSSVQIIMRHPPRCFLRSQSTKVSCKIVELQFLFLFYEFFEMIRLPTWVWGTYTLFKIFNELVQNNVLALLINLRFTFGVKGSGKAVNFHFQIGSIASFQLEN